MKKNIGTASVVQTPSHSLQAVRSDINDFLNQHYEQQRMRAGLLHADYGFLWDAIATQHRAGGKRFRPYLCLLAYEALGGTNYTSAVPIAAALELLHAAMLMHDDIIDRDFVRHNELNVAGTYQQHYGMLLTDENEVKHFANSAAILSGDLLLSDAYQLIIGSQIPAGQRLRAAELLGEAIYAVSAGELLDTEAALYPPDYADSLKIAELKTALYSCSIPLALGGMLAGANRETELALRQIGSGLGIAFQLADDLLGVFGSEQLTGKTVIGDLREGKRTYLLQRTLHLASPEQLTVLETIIGNSDCTEAMADEARAIMIACGAKAELEQLMRTYADTATKLVAELPVDAAAQARLTDFIDQAIWRTS
ncbi:MAG: polyprenyl synthetase family protein [Patescibacteria group bacterium]|nr:polyprenyl synthetase family protein [Patescibacteria group bacterium]